MQRDATKAQSHMLGCLHHLQSINVSVMYQTTDDHLLSCLRFWKNSSQSSQTSAPSSAAVSPDDWKKPLNHQLNRASHIQLRAVICKTAWQPYLLGCCWQLALNLSQRGRFRRASLGFVFSCGRCLEEEKDQLDKKPRLIRAADKNKRSSILVLNFCYF